jgi:hypothetical protein
MKHYFWVAAYCILMLTGLPFLAVGRLLDFVMMPIGVAAGYCYKRSFDRDMRNTLP